MVESGRVAALFFGVLGVLLTFALSAIGTGAFLLSRFGSRSLVAPAPVYGPVSPAHIPVPPPAGV